MTGAMTIEETREIEEIDGTRKMSVRHRRVLLLGTGFQLVLEQSDTNLPTRILSNPSRHPDCKDPQQMAVTLQ